MSTGQARRRGRVRVRALAGGVMGLVLLASGLATSGASGTGGDRGAPAAPATPSRDTVRPGGPEPRVATEPSTPPRVVLYGDSLAWEAEEHFRGAFAAVDVELETRTFGGTAICDWLPAMAEDAAEDPPVAVVVTFSGNALTPCAQDADGVPLQGEDLRARYRADAEATIAIFERVGSDVYLAGAPAGRADDPGASLPPGWVNALYAEIATVTGVSFVDAGAAVLDGGRWTATLPCLPSEPCRGGVDGVGRPVNVVRAPDGAHFCPTGDEARDGVTGACTAWSSGAYRFGRALADPVLDALPALAPHAAGIR